MGYKRSDVGPLKAPSNFQSKNYSAQRETQEQVIHIYSLKDIILAILLEGEMF